MVRSRRSNKQSSKATSNRIKSTIEEGHQPDILELPQATEEIPVQSRESALDQSTEEHVFKNVTRHNPHLVDKDPMVNVREDIGQSDLEVIYDKFSHSNPLHDFTDIDIHTEFRGQYEVSQEELSQREAFMQKYYRGEIKSSTSFEK